MTLETSQPIIGGPKKTARFGNLVTIDLSAPQGNLVVERGSTVPRASLIVTTAARHIIEASKAGEKAEHIILIGSEMDPTMHPDLKEIVENLKALRTKWFPRAKLGIMSESVNLDDPILRLVLGGLDKVFLNFEWGTTKTFSAATGEKSTRLTTYSKHLENLENVFVQARFATGDINNSAATEVKGFIKRLAEVKPVEVQVLPGVRKIAGKKLRSVPQSRLKSIVEEISEQTGLSVGIVVDEQPSAA